MMDGAEKVTRAVGTGFVAHTGDEHCYVLFGLGTSLHVTYMIRAF